MEIESANAKFLKVFISGNIVEIWQYETMPNHNEYDDNQGHESIDLGLINTRNSLENRKMNQRRSKWNFMRIVNSTFNAGSRFITFTFRDGVLSNVTNVQEANVYWDSFVKRMRRRFGNFAWAVVVEFQDTNGRGAVHFHMIADLPYIPVDDLEALWGAGYVWIEAIDHVDNVGAYVAKYMASDMSDVRLCGLKAWRVSRNVKRPVELRGDEARNFIYAQGFDASEPRLRYTYDSEYCGFVEYRQFNVSL